MLFKICVFIVESLGYLYFKGLVWNKFRKVVIGIVFWLFNWTEVVLKEEFFFLSRLRRVKFDSSVGLWNICVKLYNLLKGRIRVDFLELVGLIIIGILVVFVGFVIRMFLRVIVSLIRDKDMELVVKNVAVAWL